MRRASPDHSGAATPDALHLLRVTSQHYSGYGWPINRHDTARRPAALKGGLRLVSQCRPRLGDLVALQHVHVRDTMCGSAAALALLASVAVFVLVTRSEVNRL